MTGLVGRSDGRGGARPWLRTGASPRVLVAEMAAVIVLTACGGSGGPAATQAAIATPHPAPSAAVLATRAAMAAALQARGLSLTDTAMGVRPAEPPGFAGVPVWPFLVPMTDDSTGGLVVVYELSSVPAAAAAGQDMSAYLASGPGRVQYSADVRITLRQVGSTLVLFTYSPVGASDPRTATVAAALQSVGSEVPIAGG